MAFGDRRKPMKRTGFANRGSSQLRRSRLKPVSDKRRAQFPRRAEVRREVIARDGGCVMRDSWPHRCWHPGGPGEFDVHEIRAKGDGGDWLDPANCVTLCRIAHDHITFDADGVELGKKLGLVDKEWRPPHAGA